MAILFQGVALGITPPLIGICKADGKMKKINYLAFLGFENVYMEDSYLLEVFEFSSRLVLDLELVLMEKHALYSLPLAGEKYCYKKASLIFPCLKELDWLSRSFSAIRGVDGVVDYGNIEEFYKLNSYYYVSGEWGELKVSSNLPIIKFK